MRRGRHPKILRRRRIFLGCEGESERGYGGVLQRFLDSCGTSIHLDLVKLQPGGGDPLALVERARKLIAHRGQRYGVYEKHAILLDDDKLGLAADRDAKIEGLAKAAQITLLWQRPCHEAFLLRHLSGCGQLRPSQSADALAELRRRWPGYQKGLIAMEIAERIGEQQIRQAMTVEPAFGAFLQSLGVQ